MMSMMAESDNDLVIRAQAGDRDALGSLIDRYLPRVRKIVAKKICDNDADDVVQDIFLSLVKSISNFRAESSFVTWFMKLVNHKIADYHRKLYRHDIFVFFEDMPNSKKELFFKIEDQSGQVEMQDLLRKMPNPYREVIDMRLCQGMSFGEIALMLGNNYEAVRSVYRRAIAYAAEKI